MALKSRNFHFMNISCSMTQYSQITSYPYGFNHNGTRCITSFGTIGDGFDSMSWPWYCDIDADGNIFVADTGNNRIKFYQSQTYRVKMVAFGDDDPRSVCCLLRPKSVKLSYIPGTSLIVTDTGHRRTVLLKLDQQNGMVDHVYSFGANYFAEPTDAANDKCTGNTAVVDASLNQVSIHNQEGQIVSLCEQRGFTLNEPSAVAIAKNGEIFVSDTRNHCVRRFSRHGEYIDNIGQPGEQVRQFNHPRGLAFDDRGYFYVADEYNNRVQRFSPDFTHVTEVVSSIPFPKGLAAGKQLVVTATDENSFTKVYYP